MPGLAERRAASRRTPTRCVTYSHGKWGSRGSLLAEPQALGRSDYPEVAERHRKRVIGNARLPDPAEGSCPERLPSAAEPPEFSRSSPPECLFSREESHRSGAATAPGRRFPGFARPSPRWFFPASRVRHRAGFPCLARLPPCGLSRPHSFAAVPTSPPRPYGAEPVSALPAFRRAGLSASAVRRPAFVLAPAPVSAERPARRRCAGRMRPRPGPRRRRAGAARAGSGPRGRSAPPGSPGRRGRRAPGGGRAGR